MPPITDAEAEALLRPISEKLEHATYQTKDIDAMMAFYAPNAILASAGKTFYGLDEIRPPTVAYFAIADGTVLSDKRYSGTSELLILNGKFKNSVWQGQYEQIWKKYGDKYLLQWKGSLWKSVWHELALWSVVYAIISIAYRSWMNKAQQKKFEEVANFFYSYANLIPFSFMLAFYVSFVVSRWQHQFNIIGFVDKSVMLVASYIRGSDEKARTYRRAVVRYICLLQVLVFRTICSPIKRRFPTLQSLTQAGYLEEGEQPDVTDTSFYVPIRWAMQNVRDAREYGIIRGDLAVSDIHKELLSLRGNLLMLWLLDWVPVPLLYTQVISVSVRVYLVAMLIGRQFIHDSSRYPIDIYVPFMTMIQLVVYIGWLKVAESLLNPFGEDDDDFNCNWILDRNLQVGMAIADMGECDPFLRRDKYWNEAEVTPLYSEETSNSTIHPCVGSAILTDLTAAEPRRLSSVSKLASLFHLSTSNDGFIDRISGASTPTDITCVPANARPARRRLSDPQAYYNRKTSWVPDTLSPIASYPSCSIIQEEDSETSGPHRSGSHPTFTTISPLTRSASI